MAGGHAATTIYHVADGVLAPALTPHGALVLRSSSDGVALPPGLGAALQAVFRPGSRHGLLALDADHVGAVLPPGLSYWRELRIPYVTALCALPGLGDGRDKPPVRLPANERYSA
jgi:non-specific serine/threonine protein kinase